MSDCTTPTPVEIAAAEKVLAEAFDDGIQIAPDGYYRPVAEAVLTAASRAQLAEWVAMVDANLAEELTRGRTVPDTLVGHVVHGLVGEDTLDAALGEGRR